MMYLWPQSGSMTHLPEAFGVITQPGNGMVPLGIVFEGRSWACDNGAFTRFDKAAYLAHLERLRPYRNTCLFVVVPDVVGNAVATLELYENWRAWFRLTDWPLAFVAQDGQEDLPLPDFDWLFIGGSTRWKMGAGARYCVEQAHKLGKPVHVGRVNSWRRYQYFKSLGARSCDGTHPIYEPDKASITIAEWMERPFNYSLFSGYRGGKPHGRLVGSEGDDN